MPSPYKPRPYYSERKNGRDVISIDLDDLRELIFLTYEYLSKNGYLAEAFGFHCIDGDQAGYVDAFTERKLKKRGLWPIGDAYKTYNEDDCLTVVEFLYDHVSEPQTVSYHSYYNCGEHYSDYDREKGRIEYRSRISEPLRTYGQGWEISEDGEVMSLPPTGLETLLAAKSPTSDTTVLERVEDAKSRFRRHGSTLKEREVAVRDLADVLEWIKPQVNIALMNKDSSELYNIANNFGIRHLNQNQKNEYDKPVWLSWIFYHYLNTINACLHIVERQSR